jgi:pimeloyl-ACP methyl ester carboxylesterase
VLPLVFLPGVDGDPEIWRRVMERLGPHEARAVELPRGGSLHDLASQVHAQISWTRYGVVGLSFGGLVGRALAELHEDAVSGLIMVGTLPSRDFLPRHIELATQMLPWMPTPMVRNLYRRRIYGRLRAEGVADRDAVALSSRLPDKDRYVERLRMIQSWGLGSQVRVPALLLRGREEVEAPWTLAQAQRALPGLSVEAIDGGHRAPWTSPDALSRRILSFMDSGQAF